MTTHSQRPARPVAEKPASAPPPTPAPIASRTAKPKNVKREAPVEPARETEPRRPIASSHASSRKTDAPLKPFYEDEEALASGPAPAGSRTRVTPPLPARQMEVRRAEPVEQADDNGRERHRLFGEPRSRRDDGFFHRLFHDED